MLRDRLNLPGILEPWESLGILADLRGSIVEVLVDEGQNGKAG